MSRRAASIAAVVFLVPALAAAQPAPAAPVVVPAPAVPPGLMPVFPPGAVAPGPPNAYVPPPAGSVAVTAPPSGYALPYPIASPYPPSPLDLEAPGMELLLPTTLSFEEGQTVPRGYALKSRSPRSLLVAGTLSFGTAYLASLIGAATALTANSTSGTSYAPLFVPVIGPYIAIGTAQASGAGAVWLVLDGLAQTGGATLFVYSLVAEEKYLSRKARDTGSALDVLAHPAVFVGPRMGVARWAF